MQKSLIKVKRCSKCGHEIPEGERSWIARNCPKCGGTLITIVKVVAGKGDEGRLKSARDAAEKASPLPPGGSGSGSPILKR